MLYQPFGLVVPRPYSRVHAVILSESQWCVLIMVTLSTCFCGLFICQCTAGVIIWVSLFDDCMNYRVHSHRGASIELGPLVDRSIVTPRFHMVMVEVSPLFIQYPCRKLWYYYMCWCDGGDDGSSMHSIDLFFVLCCCGYDYHQSSQYYVDNIMLLVCECDGRVCFVSSSFHYWW